MGNADGFGCCEGVFKQRDTGEERSGAGDAQLVLKFLGRIRSACRRGDAGKTMDGVRARQKVNLGREDTVSQRVLHLASSLDAPC